MFLRWENFKKEIGHSNDIVKVQYAILFRQYEEIFKCNPTDDLLSKYIFKYVNDEWIECKELTLKNCIEWNYGYINKGLQKIEQEKITDNQTELLYLDDWKTYFNILSNSNELDYYTTLIYEDKDIFELFFNNNQPMLDVEYLKKQENASKQLQQLNYQLIFDEVGTGKTVSALYCIRDVLINKGLSSKILIICPNNKKAEWKSDIQRQLGRYVHTIENNDNSLIYKRTKELYFKKNEPYIFIEGQKIGALKEDCNSWTNDTKWDIVIIDEGHLCFDNYKNLKAEKAVILTATPIVINSNTKDGVLEISKLRSLKDYIDLLKCITDSTEEVKLNSLFRHNNIFTQLFREDIGLSSKQRNITFLECERFEDREYYLELLGEVKGGMARLVYEQDDDYLLYGVFERFKQDIVDRGYVIPDNQPKIDKKKEKFKILKDFLNNNEINSYIIFCNYKYPTDNIYNKLIENQKDLKNKENTIIIKKYGSDKLDLFPKDSSVTKDNIFEYITNCIQNGKRVIFMTTGASGGTGLNLGAFDGVINYELPFTCIELEQRFGRVDRMNSNAESKDMVFILNDDMNPMLRYSVLKINATCMYMPIRNTVLFYPKFVEKNIESLKKEIESCTITDDEKGKYDKVFTEREKVISDNKTIVEKIEQYLIKKKSLDKFEVNIEVIENYANLLNENTEAVLSYYYKSKKLKALSVEVDNWVNLINSGEVRNEYGSAQYVDEVEIIQEEYKENEKNLIGNGIIVNCEEKSEDSGLFTKLPKNLTVGSLLKSLNSMAYDKQEGTSGVFYIKDNKYIRQTVTEFREDVK